jgi:radical SAM superfamily enzyme YgiQ (UPF0313 family)
MTRTVIYSIPPLDKERPPLAAAILASICRDQGHDCIVFDLQNDLDCYLEKNNITTDYFNNVFYERTPSFDDEQIKILNDFIDQHLELSVDNNTDFVLVSFFSFLAQPFGSIFLEKLRPATRAKIIIGGAGLIKDSSTDIVPYPEKLKNRRLVDEYIIGEAEKALIQCFDQKSGPGIGNYNAIQIADLDNCPWPDYNYFNLNKYNVATKGVTIIGSRGCVRRCTFCNVRVTSPKYKFRSGQNIANEIIHHYETHGITKFYFADSLVNGSFKAFDDMCNALIRYNFKEKISWSGQYIIRSIKQTPKNHFQMLHESGCETLFIGLETGSDRTRFELGKPFTNDDTEFYLENFSKYGTQVLFLMFTGYITETSEDHQETLSLFKRWQKYVATGTIQGIETLNILSILSGTSLRDLAEEKDFLFLQDHMGNLNLSSWIDPSRPDYDFKKRVSWHFDMIEEAIKYKWPLWNGSLSIRLYEQALTKFAATPKTHYITIKSANARM